MKEISKAAPVYVIGAGITGLGGAHYLKKNGYMPVILEQSDNPGGRAGYTYQGATCLETGGKNFSTTWPLCNQLLDEFNIREFDDQHVNHHIVLNGKAVSFDRKIKIPESLPMLRFLGFRGAYQLLKTLKYVKKNRTHLGYATDKIAILEKRYDTSPITNYYSPRLAHSLFRMIGIIMGGAEPEETYYSNLLNFLKTAMDGGRNFAIRGGIARLFEKLLEKQPIQYNTNVRQIIIQQNRVTGLLISHNGQEQILSTTKVISAVPLNQLKTMLAFPPAVLSEVERIRYFPVAIINALYDKDVFTDQIHSIMFDNGYHLGHCSANRLYRQNSVRFTLAGERARQVLDQTDDALIELAEREFSSVIPLRNRRRNYHIQRHPVGMCAYCANYSSARAKIKAYIASIEGLEIAGDYLEGHNLEHCLLSADKAVQRITESHMK